MIINKKIKRTMLESKSQYLGSVLLIVISCLLYTLLNQLSSNMDQMASSFEKSYIQEDASFTTGEDLNIPELESRFGTRIEKGAAFDFAVLGDKTLRIFSENTKVNLPAVTEGAGLSGNDILLDPAFAKANGLKIGNTLKILDKPFKIAGFMSLPNYIYPLKSETDVISNPDSFGTAVVRKEDFEKFGRGNSFYSVKFNSDNGGVEEQAARFREYMKNEGIFINQWTDIADNKRVAFVNTKIEGISKMSSAAPVAILLLTCILTGIVVWRLLRRESAIIGTLYAQGYRRTEIKRHYLIYPLSIALIGGITGTLFGALLLKPMLEYMVSYFNMPIISIAFNPGYIAVSLLLPVFFLGVSGYLVLGRELGYSPVELMKGGRTKSKVNFVEGKLRLDRFKFSAKFKIREQLRSLSRLIFLLLGVAMATMLLLLGFTAKSSLDYLMKDSFKNTFKFQYEYVYNSLHKEQPPSNAEAFSAAAFALKSDDKTVFTVSGISPGSRYVVLKDKTGDDLEKENVIMTKPLAARLKAGPGDTVRAVNKLDSKEYAITVDSIAETYAGEFIFMPISQFDELLGYPAGSYAGLWSDTKLEIPEKALYSARSVDEGIRDFSASTQPLQATIGVIAFMSFIIGLIVIYVVTSLIIEENKGNISLMKIFGYRRKEVNSLILNSTSMVIVAGYILGIPLILLSMSALFKSLTESIRLTLPVTIGYPYILVGFAVVYLTYELSKALSRKKVDRISMSEALKAGME